MPELRCPRTSANHTPANKEHHRDRTGNQTSLFINNYTGRRREHSSERFEYEGNSIILNRENTEMSNRTITSKEQAEIVFDDGHWYLLDRSMLQTTYIQVNRKIEIIPDDIIVLGDRRFKFECD